VAASVERHLNAPQPVSLSGAAMQVLTIVAYRQPVSQAGIESVRGTSSDSTIVTLLQQQLIASTIIGCSRLLVHFGESRVCCGRPWGMKLVR